MTADLKRIFCTPGLSMTLDHTIPGAAFPEIYSDSLENGVEVSGSVYNRADVVHLDYTVKFTLNIVCDRCLKELRKNFEFDFKRIVVKKADTENDEFISAENDRLDVDEAVISDVILSLPSKMLCSENCAGLCPICGQDLNEAECDCKK